MLRFVPRVVAILLSAVPLSVFHVPTVRAAEPFQFEGVELSTRLQVGYAVRVVDVNGDGLLDIAIVDSKRIL